MKDGKICPPSVGKFSKLYKAAHLICGSVFLALGLTVIFYNKYDNYRKETIYNSLDMSFLSARVVEYGTKEYDTREIIENIDDGVIRDYTKEIDTSVVGVQKVSYEIGLEDVTKSFDSDIEIVDTKPPIIEIKSDNISLYTGTSYDVKSNISSVRDQVDGDIAYSESHKDDKKDYYTIETNFNKNSAGTYEVKILAYDRNGIETTRSYTINVKNKPVPVVRQVQSYSAPSGSYTGSASIDTSSVVGTARSLLGYRYVYAGESPSVGFDCSGLVKYVYKVHGVSLGHGTYAQAGAGHAVSRENMQPGDIIVWSTKSNNAPTHTAIYVGGDTMIHAANPRTGVIQSSVSYWESHGGGHIATIRRV